MNEVQFHSAAAAQQASQPQRGLIFTRRFTTEGVSPYDEIQWEQRTASIGDLNGNCIFEQKDVEVPSDWSVTATNIVASKYLHGHLGPRSGRREFANWWRAWRRPSATGA